jgi:hypothetical protein
MPMSYPIGMPANAGKTSAREVECDYSLALAGSHVCVEASKQ